MFLLDNTGLLNSIFDVVFMLLAIVIGLLISVITLFAIFDGVQKRAYDNKKKWDDENKILRG